MSTISNRCRHFNTKLYNKAIMSLSKFTLWFLKWHNWGEKWMIGWHFKVAHSHNQVLPLIPELILPKDPDTTVSKGACLWVFDRLSFLCNIKIWMSMRRIVLFFLGDPLKVSILGFTFGFRTKVDISSSTIILQFLGSFLACLEPTILSALCPRFALAKVPCGDSGSFLIYIFLSPWNPTEWWIMYWARPCQYTSYYVCLKSQCIGPVKMIDSDIYEFLPLSFGRLSVP